MLVAENVVNHSNGNLTVRSYEKVSGSLPLPNLVEIQTDSFRWFVEEGIKEVFRDVYPIAGPGNSLELDFVNCRFEDPKYDVDDCKNRDMTYARPLKVTLRLRNNLIGEINESEVFMGDFPWMTERGLFLGDGAQLIIPTAESAAA